MTERFNSGAIFLMWLGVKAARPPAVKPYGNVLVAPLRGVTVLLFSFLLC